MHKKLIIWLGSLVIITASLALPAHRLFAACLPGEPCGGGGTPAVNAFLTKTDLDNATYTTSPPFIVGTIKGTEVQFADSNMSDSTYNFKPGGTMFCDGTVFGGKDPNKGITLNTAVKDINATSATASENLDYVDSNGNCQNYQTTIVFTKQASGKWVGLTTAVTSAPGAGSSSQPDACGANTNGLTLAWLICPSIDAASGMANGLEGLYEDQLSFTVSQLLGNQDSQDHTKATWSLMKNLASAFLVIIMLVAVLSQAVGGGLLDAYAIRKILPRLVVAVILIQVSWYLLAWVVDFFNALGNGIANLMYVPFGGASKMQLGTLLQNANITPYYTGTVGWLGFAAIIGFGIADLPMLLLLVLAVVVALVAALVTLMFRKILIIMCLIFAPLALLAWILPGTQRYYKMWSDNFLKALFMFPLVIAIIAAGRIFAYIAGTQDNSQFLNFFMVLVGFFGPLFILPKTFKWGGSVMQMAGSGISNGFNKLSSPGKSYLQGLHGRSRWMMAKQTRESIQTQRARHGFAEGLTSSGARGRINRARIVRPGRPSSEGEILRRATQNAQAEVAKAYDEELQGATAELTQVLLPDMVNKGASHDLVREAIALKKDNAVVGRRQKLDASGNAMKDARGNNIYEDIIFNGAEYANSHPLSQRAALDRMIVHGQWGAIDQYLEKAEKGTPEERAAANAFKNSSSNAPAIGQKLTHQLKGWGVAITSNEGDIGNMSGHEVESLVAHYTTEIAKGRAPGASTEQKAASAQAANEFNGFLRRFESARANPNINLDTRAIKSMDAYYGALRGDPQGIREIEDINTGANKRVLAEEKGAFKPDPTDPEKHDPQLSPKAVEDITREGSRDRYDLEDKIVI